MEKDNLERNVIQPLLKEFSREMLSRLIEISFIELEQAPTEGELQANGNPQDEKGYTKYESRYLAQKELFSLMLFDPMLEEQISMRKNANFDYMTGLHFFITANKNFHYNFGFFEQQIDFFDQILNGWCNFLDQVVRDVTALQGFITEQCVELEFDGILRLFLCKDTIISASLNLDSFNTILKNEQETITIILVCTCVKEITKKLSLWYLVKVTGKAKKVVYTKLLIGLTTSLNH